MQSTWSVTLKSRLIPKTFTYIYGVKFIEQSWVVFPTHMIAVICLDNYYNLSYRVSDNFATHHAVHICFHLFTRVYIIKTKLDVSHSISITFHTKDNTPFSPSYNARSTAPYFSTHYIWNLCRGVDKWPWTALNLTASVTAISITDLSLQANFNVCSVCYNNTISLQVSQRSQSQTSVYRQTLMSVVFAITIQSHYKCHSDLNHRLQFTGKL
jgi:hypothetical protein